MSCEECPEETHAPEEPTDPDAPQSMTTELGRVATAPSIAAGITESHRRREVAQQLQAAQAAAAGAAGAAPAGNHAGAAAVNRKKDEFLAATRGWWVVTFANVDYLTRRAAPTLRLLGYFRTKPKADEYVRRCLFNPEVKCTPSIVPANTPFLIPYSVAASQDKAHIFSKLARLQQRHSDFTDYRMREFAERVADSTNLKPATAELGQSNYAHLKTYQARLAEQAASAAASDGQGGGAGGERPLCTLPRMEEEEATLAETAAAAARPQPVLPEPSKTVTLESFLDAEAPPPPAVVAIDDLPAHWKRWTAGAAAGAPTLIADCNETFPAELSAQRGVAILSVVLDKDTPTDSPAYPGAAGNEPMCVIFGGVYENVEDAKKVIKEDIQDWATDIPLDAVDTLRWLGPMEVDPDHHPDEEFRTGSRVASEEFNTVMRSQKETLRENKRILTAAEQMGTTIPVTHVNHVPNVEDVFTAHKPVVVVDGTPEQFDAAGVRIAGPTVVDDTTETGASAAEDPTDTLLDVGHDA
jgi:hypothetical protein